ncbi:hydrogenase maturation protease [uncultured Thermanaerothrix sp.]|uniref:hydrogenase maturation protease n=1 Tax=uncultured Thermanaerothrix sp. TaxID=1195149 RepID=UPI0026095A24|nr:hydrogenase maturation protease [uncultured Thermanaerothrix sp.]
MAPRILIIGIGNPDRQDDGVAWHLIYRLAEQLGYPVGSELDGEIGEISVNPCLTLRTGLQLTPEMAEEIVTYTHVCFVDAHTGSFPEEITWLPLHPGFQPSPLSHHLTPESCLALAETLYGHAPQAILLSLRGYEFGFARELSPRTRVLLETAVDSLLRWLTSLLPSD